MAREQLGQQQDWPLRPLHLHHPVVTLASAPHTMRRQRLQVVQPEPVAGAG